MHDGIEGILQVDSLGQAVGGDQDPSALGGAEQGHARLALLGRHLAGHGADGDALQVLAQVAGHVVGGRDEAAEHHHVEPLRDQLRDVRRGGPELRIAALAGEALRLRYQARQRRAVAADRGLDVVRDQRVDFTVEDAVEQILAGLVAQILAGAGAQGQHGRDGARPGAAQEGQRPPEVETLSPLVPGARLHDLGAVIEDGVEKRLPGSGELVGEFPRFAAREEVAVVPLGNVGPAPLHEVPRQTGAEPVARRTRGFRQAFEVRRQQAEQAVERGVVAAVRRRREQDEGAAPRCRPGPAAVRAAGAGAGPAAAQVCASSTITKSGHACRKWSRRSRVFT